MKTIFFSPIFFCCLVLVVPENMTDFVSRRNCVRKLCNMYWKQIADVWPWYRIRIEFRFKLNLIDNVGSRRPRSQHFPLNFNLKYGNEVYNHIWFNTLKCLLGFAFLRKWLKKSRQKFGESNSINFFGISSNINHSDSTLHPVIEKSFKRKIEFNKNYQKITCLAFQIT